MWQKIALILIGLGTLVLTGWVAWIFFSDPEVPLLIKITIGAGLLLLAIAIILTFSPFDGDSRTETASPSEPESRSLAGGTPVEQYTHLFRGRVLDGSNGEAESER